MFPIGESLAIRNLERAVSAGNGNSPPGTAVSTLRSGVRRLRIRMRFNPVFARCGSRRWSPRSPRAGNGPPGTAVPTFRSGVRPLRVAALEPAVSAGNGNGPPGTAVPTLRPGVRRSRIRIRCGVRPLRVAALEPAVSAGNDARG